MLSFSLVAEALTGLIYHRPSAENSKFLPSVCKAKGVKQWSSLLGMWSTTLRIHILEDFVLVEIADQPLFDLAL